MLKNQNETGCDQWHLYLRDKFQEICALAAVNENMSFQSDSNIGDLSQAFVIFKVNNIKCQMGIFNKKRIASVPSTMVPAIDLRCRRLFFALLVALFFSHLS